MPPNPPAHTQLRRRQLQAPTPPAPATETLSSTYYRSLLDAIIALSVISILCVLALGFQALYYRRKWLRNIAVNGASRRKTIDITFDGESDISVAGTIDSASVRSVPNPKSYKLPAPQPPIPLQVFAPPSVPHPHLSAPHLRPPAGREPQRGVRPPRRPPQSIRHPPRGPQRQPPRSRIATGQPRTPRSRPTHSDAASEPSAEDSQLENIDEIPPPETRRSFPDELPDPARSQFDEPPPQGQPTPSRHSGPPSTAPGNQASSAHGTSHPPSLA
ncbi:ESCRT-0 subunit protein hse1 [Trapelia coarctata]|nr:ESCRT-0 subunit protein hse1 [Trapelia coarctata]